MASSRFLNSFVLRGRRVAVLRDDLFRFGALRGNKARKMQWMAREHGSDVHVVSWGGVQSNAMASLARLCAEKQWKFTYITRDIPKDLVANPVGNLRTALRAGASVVACPSTLHRTFARRAESSHDLLSQGVIPLEGSDGGRSRLRDCRQALLPLLYDACLHAVDSLPVLRASPHGAALEPRVDTIPCDQLVEMLASQEVLAAVPQGGRCWGAELGATLLASQVLSVAPAALEGAAAPPPHPHHDRRRRHPDPSPPRLLPVLPAGTGACACTTRHLG